MVYHMEEPNVDELDYLQEQIDEIAAKIEVWSGHTDAERLAFMLMRRFGIPEACRLWLEEEEAFENPWGVNLHADYLKIAEEILKIVSFEVAVKIIKLITGE